MLKRVKDIWRNLVNLENILAEFSERISVIQSASNAILHHGALILKEAVALQSVDSRISTLESQMFQIENMDKKLIDLEAKLAHLVCGKPPAKPKPLKAKKSKEKK